MADEQDRLFGVRPTDVLDDPHGTLLVDSGERLIHEENRLLLEQRTGDDEHLPLSAGEPQTALIQHRIQPIRHVAQPFVAGADAKSFFYLFFRHGGMTANKQILLYRTRDQDVLLGQIGDLFPKVLFGISIQRRTRDGDIALVRIEAYQRFDERRFAASGCAAQRGYPARGDIQRVFKSQLLFRREAQHGVRCADALFLQILPCARAGLKVLLIQRQNLLDAVERGQIAAQGNQRVADQRKARNDQPGELQHDHDLRRIHLPFGQIEDGDQHHAHILEQGRAADHHIRAALDGGVLASRGEIGLAQAFGMP